VVAAVVVVLYRDQETMGKGVEAESDYRDKEQVEDLV
jgi:hypothetical protein